MFHRFAPTLAAIALAAAATFAATPARASSTISLETSPAWWGANGDHADLVLYYDHVASGPLTIEGIYFTDLSGAVLTQGYVTCGRGTSAGQVLNPGQYCFVRAYRSNAAIVARVVFSDGSSSNTNINTFVRASAEIRDAADTMITHLEAH